MKKALLLTPIVIYKYRLAATCCYDFVYTGPSLTILDQCVIPSTRNPEQGAAGAQGILDLAHGVQSDAIMALISSANADWRESTERYFRNVHPWLSIVHPARLAASLGPDGDAPRRPEVALLFVCMHLITESASSFSSSPLSASSQTRDVTNAMFSSPAYVGARRALGLLRASGDPCVELVQCGILLGLYEFGHGEYERAYVTIGDANTMAQVMKLRPGKYADIEEGFHVPPDEEERRSVYWGLFVVDRYAQPLSVPLDVVYTYRELTSPTA